MNTNALKSINRQQGYSLVELSVALSIVAVVLVAGLMGARQVLTANSTNNQIRESNKVINNIRKALQNQTTTASLATSDIAVKLGVWPADRATCAANASGIYDATKCGTVSAVLGGANEYVFTNTAQVGTNMPINSGFWYVLYNIPNQACVDLVNGLSGSAYAIYAGATTTAPTTGATPNTATYTAVKVADQPSVNLANLATGCSSKNNRNDLYVAVQI